MVLSELECKFEIAWKNNLNLQKCKTKSVVNSWLFRFLIKDKYVSSVQETQPQKY